MRSGVVRLSDVQVLAFPVVGGDMEVGDLDKHFTEGSKHFECRLNFFLGFISLDGGRNNDDVEVLGADGVSV